jgi:hypothetical protein
MQAKHQDILDAIREGGQLTDELTPRLIAAIEGYNASYAARLEAVGASA